MIQISRIELNELIEKSVAQAVLPLKREIEALKIEVSQLGENQEFTSAQYDTIHSEHSKILVDCKKHKLDIAKLTDSTKHLIEKAYNDEGNINQLEQYDRRQNLEIEGLGYQKSEKVSQTIVNLSNKLGMNTRKADISVAHRLPPK